MLTRSVFGRVLEKVQVGRNGMFEFWVSFSAKVFRWLDAGRCFIFIRSW